MWRSWLDLLNAPAVDFSSNNGADGGGRNSTHVQSPLPFSEEHMRVLRGSHLYDEVAFVRSLFEDWHALYVYENEDVCKVLSTYTVSGGDDGVDGDGGRGGGEGGVDGSTLSPPPPAPLSQEELLWFVKVRNVVDGISGGMRILQRTHKTHLHSQLHFHTRSK